MQGRAASVEEMERLGQAAASHVQAGTVIALVDKAGHQGIVGTCTRFGQTKRRQKRFFYKGTQKPFFLFFCSVLANHNIGQIIAHGGRGNARIAVGYFFDNNDVIISTPVVWKEGSHSFLCDIDGAPAAISFKTRREAEMYAVENAIILLEGRLNSN